MNNDQVLTSMSKFIAFWYTKNQNKKEIVYPHDKTKIKQITKILNKDTFKANIIISDNKVYAISKEISCELQNWSYIYYLDEVTNNRRTKKSCEEILSYSLKDSKKERIKKILENEMSKNYKRIVIEINDEDSIYRLEKILKNNLNELWYLDLKNKNIISYADMIDIDGNKINILISKTKSDKKLNKIKNEISKDKALTNKKIHINQIPA